MSEITISVAVPQWLLDRLEKIAAICDRPAEQVAISFFASEVVHT